MGSHFGGYICCLKKNIKSRLRAELCPWLIGEAELWLVKVEAGTEVVNMMSKSNARNCAEIGEDQLQI